MFFIKIAHLTIAIDPDKLYIAAEAAEILRVATETIRRRARKGEIGYIKQGKRGDYYFLGIDIINYLRKNHFNPF